jgi:hypothetical protein
MNDMDREDTPLLLLVQGNVVPEHERAFNLWYYQHVPTLLEIPGYLWGRRYVNVLGDVKYLALYEIAGVSFLESLLGPDKARRHALANAEFDKFEKLQGLSDVRINVYRQLSGTHLGHPLLHLDLPISVVMVDCIDPDKEAAFNDWYTHSHAPNLVRIAGYFSAARFALVDHGALDWLNMGPKYLALYELENLQCIPSIADPEQMSPEARAELENWKTHGVPVVDRFSWNIYRPLARHWPL